MRYVLTIQFFMICARLVASPKVAPVDFEIKSPSQLVALQFDLSLPKSGAQAASLSGLRLQSQITDHALDYREISSGVHRVVIYSSKNTPVPEGKLLEALVELLNSTFLRDLSVQISNIVFAQADGGTASASMQILPVIALMHPETARGFVVRHIAVLSAEAVLPAQGNVARVEFLVDGQTVAEVAKSPFAAEWLPMTTGEFAIAAVAHDDQGNRQQSEPVRVTVFSLKSINSYTGYWNSFYPGASENRPLTDFRADPNGDGYSNAAAFFLGADPLSDLAGWITSRLDRPTEPSRLLIQFTRLATQTQVGYRLDISTDLNSWKPLSSDRISALDNGDGTETVSVSLSATEQRNQFIRVSLFER
jgi:hypothetical protein